MVEAEEGGAVLPGLEGEMGGAGVEFVEAGGAGVEVADDAFAGESDEKGAVEAG